MYCIWFDTLFMWRERKQKLYKYIDIYVCFKGNHDAYWISNFFSMQTSQFRMNRNADAIDVSTDSIRSENKSPNDNEIIRFNDISILLQLFSIRIYLRNVCMCVFTIQFDPKSASICAECGDALTWLLSQHHTKHSHLFFSFSLSFFF